MKRRERSMTGRTNMSSSRVEVENKMSQKASQQQAKGTRGAEAGSWGELLQEYKKSATSLPWKGEDQSRPDYRTSYSIKREERMFDPIQAKFRDPAMEDTFARMEKADMHHTITKGKDRAAEHNQPFNIISNKRPHGHNSGRGKVVKAKDRVPDSHTPWNILSNKNLPPGSVQYEAMKETHAMKEWEHMQQRLEHPEEAAQHAPGTQEHDFNIVSNKYLDDHEGKQRMDDDAALHLAASKYWHTHNYNPITGKFCDPSKEQRYLQYSQEMANHAGEEQAEHMPASVKQREGAAYDILTNMVRPKMDDKAKAVLSMQDRYAKNPQRCEMEQKARLKARDDDDKYGTQVNNRFTIHGRPDTTGNSTFNIVNNESARPLNNRTAEPVKSSRATFAETGGRSRNARAANLFSMNGEEGQHYKHLSNLKQSAWDKCKPQADSGRNWAGSNGALSTRRSGALDSMRSSVRGSARGTQRGGESYRESQRSRVFGSSRSNAQF